MDRLLVYPPVQSTFLNVGSIDRDKFVISPDAPAVLKEILYKLTYEDQTLRTSRCAIGSGQYVRTDLIPLLETAKDDDIIDLAIRILVNLTTPVECLFSVDIMYRTEMGRQTIFEVNKLLYASKEAFSNAKSTKPVVDYMKRLVKYKSKQSPHKYDQINNCLLLLRNILHIPESNLNFILPAGYAGSSQSAVSMQNSIMWNLFIHGIDKLLLYMMTSPQRAVWSVTMAQLIALMYKDQHVSTLQKLLNVWVDGSLSESSEDNESNTSPRQQISGDSSPMLTSDRTSDSSDYGGGSKNESSDDRRQALREETNTTLQEVSRKGHQYQNSILRVPAKQHGEAEEQQCLSDVEEKEEPLNSSQPQSQSQSQLDNHQETQPAQPSTNTSKDVDNVNTDFHESSSSSRADQVAIFLHPKSLLLTNDNSSGVRSANSPDNTKLPQNPNHQKIPHRAPIQLTMGKSCPQKRECPSSQSEVSDCGYGTQVENQESISTSSNDDDAPTNGKPQHQKPPCNTKPRNKQRTVNAAIDQKEFRRKKLVKRSRSSLINMKGLVPHTPTDDVISNLLKEFAVDFLLKGFDSLIEALHTQLLGNLNIPIDTSHFFWMVTYFLKFAAQLELDLEHIHSILTYDVISYLTYEGVMLCEQLELSSRQAGSDIKPYLRRMHFLVTAIREFLQAIESYKKVSHLSADDQAYLQKLQVQICSSEDLRCLFVLLLRRFNPSLQTREYLQDLIVTNHILLVMLDSVIKSDAMPMPVTIKMEDHISQFASLEVMHFYGLLLEDFTSNGEFVNECIFTMMHHISGDLGKIRTLFQPVILKTFSRIWETDYQLCDDWSDLIEYVIHKFMNTPQKSRLTIPLTALTELTKEYNLENTINSWAQEDMDTLYWYYVRSKKTKDIVGKIVQLFGDNGNKQKSRISIIQQLLQQDIITLVEYDDLMKFEDAEYERTLLTTPTFSTAESGIELKDSATCRKPSEDIQILRDLIVKENKENHLIWLQKFLLECCYVKLMLDKSKDREKHHNLKHIMEPVTYHSILKNRSIPVVQWNTDQAETLLYQPFVLLLHKLGFQLPADAGSVFARIPDYWSAETMYNLAGKLGPLDKLLIKFDVNLLDQEIIGNVELQRKSSRSDSAIVVDAECDTDYEDFDTIDTKDCGAINANTPNALTDCTEWNDDNRDFHVSGTFAVPKAKHSNSIIRYTPDPVPMPSVPNWLQLVMRSKCTKSSSDKLDLDVTMPDNDVMSNLLTTATTASVPTSHLMAAPITCASSINRLISGPSTSKEAAAAAAAAAEQQQQLLQQTSILSDDDSSLKSLDGNDRNDSSSSGFYTSGNLDSEYSAMVASVYENEIENFDTESIASDMTRMYVSDEEDEIDFSLAKDLD